jgi:outer membrane receptor for ferrienterochelin and colicin
MKKSLKTILFFLFLTVPGIQMNAQIVNGTVMGDEGEKSMPVPGVNIYWANSSIGTISDENGKFELYKPASYHMLVFSFVGYRSDTIHVDGSLEGYTHVMTPGEVIDEVQIVARSPGSFIDRMDPVLTEKITGVELTKAACCNLSESFETNASVDAYYANAATGAKQIRLLGLDGQYVQMLTENIPNMRGLALPYGLDYIPGPWMDGIHVSKGTSSVKNGFESITGQINVEYLKPEMDDHVFFNAFANSKGRKEVNLIGSASLGDRLGTALMTHYSDNSQEDDINNDGFMDHPMKRQLNILNRWKYTGVNLRMQFGIKALSESRTSGQLGFMPEEARGLDKPYGISINTERVEGFAKIAYLFNNDMNSNFGSIYSITGHNQNSFFGLREYSASERNVYINLMFQTDVFNEKHNITSGLSLVHDLLNETLDQRNIEFVETVPGLFTEYSFNPDSRITVMGGLRADFSSLYGLAFTPRLHARINPFASSTIRISAGKGYRTPHVLAEMNHFLASSRRIILEENFEREEAWNYGLSLTQYIGTGPRQLTLTLEANRTSFINQVIMDLDSSVNEVHFYNLDGKSFSNNYQAEISAEPVRGLESRIAFRYNDVKYDWNGEMLIKPLLSKYKGLLNFSYQTNLKKWQFDYTLQLNGPGRIPSTAANPAEYRLPEEFPAFTVMNAQVTKFFRTWNVYIGVENLTGFRQENPVLAAENPYGEHFDASLIWGPVDGRRIYAGVRWNLAKSE